MRLAPAVPTPGTYASLVVPWNTLRVVPEPDKTCNGCFNRHWLNPGDWEWCPEHKDTPRHFECTKTITPDMVIDGIESIIGKKEKKTFFGKFKNGPPEAVI